MTGLASSVLSFVHGPRTESGTEHSGRTARFFHTFSSSNAAICILSVREGTSNPNGEGTCS